jgi:hypothetical protein
MDVAQQVFVDLTTEDDDSPYSTIHEPLQEMDQECTLLNRLRSIMRYPPPGPFCRADLTWEHFVTSGARHNVASEVAVVPWDRLQDFVDGEQSSKTYPCKFLKGITKRNPPGSLERPRAYSPMIQIQ